MRNVRLEHSADLVLFPLLRKFARVFFFFRPKVSGRRARDKGTKVNGVFREFSMPFIVSPSALLWPLSTSRGGKAAAEPGTERRPSANFSKARATAIAIIPNEKVMRAESSERNSNRASRSMVAFIFYGSRRSRRATCSRDIANAHLVKHYLLDS